MFMSIIYHYTSLDNAKKIIEGGKIRISPPCDLNDPFDFMPGGYLDLSIEKIEERMFSSQLIRLEAENSFRLYRHIYSVKTLEEFIHSTQHGKIFKITYLPKILEGLKDRDFRELIPAMSEKMGIFCASNKRDEILMWSHYGAKHGGIAIGFDREKLGRIGNISDVRYQDKRGLMPFSNSHDYQSRINEILFTKYEKWIYEDEVRLLVSLKNPRVEKRNGLYLASLPKDSIQELVFGGNVNNNEETVLVNLIDKNLQRCQKLKAYFSRKKYAIEIKTWDEWEKIKKEMEKEAPYLEFYNSRMASIGN